MNPLCRFSSWNPLSRFLAAPLARRLLGSFIIFAISAFLILPNLGHPNGLVFDEAYYVTHAQKYINGVFFLQTHPPLGKLLIAAGQRWLHPDAPSNEFVSVESISENWPTGVDVTGYRLFPAFLATLNPVLVFLILVFILGHELYSLGISLFIAFDNALIVEARTAMLDTSLIFFILASLLLFVLLMRRTHHPPRSFVVLVAALGGAVACAADVKLSGFATLLFVALYGLRLLVERQFRQAIALTLVFISVFAIVYFGIWQVHFSIAKQFDPTHNYGVSEAHRRILQDIDHPDPVTRFVIQFKDATNYEIATGITQLGKLDLGNMGIGSPWYWWLVGGRVINFRFAKDNGVDYSYNILIGNPTTWLVSLLGVILGTGLVLIDLLFRFLPKENRQWPYIFALLYWAYMLPFIFTPRITYLHHYLPPMIIGVIMFSIVLWHAQSLRWTVKRDALVLGIILLVFTFWVYKPFTYAEPITIHQFQQRNIIPTWDLKCLGC